MVMVPPQTPHWYQQIDGVVTYLEIRFDVGAPAGRARHRDRRRRHQDGARRERRRGAGAADVLGAGRRAARSSRRTSSSARKPQGGGAHELGTEVHHILEGSGTLVTGGRVVRSGADGQATIEGGDSHQVAPGDVVLIPANTPHWYKDVDGSIRYLEVRFELPKP